MKDKPIPAKEKVAYLVLPPDAQLPDGFPLVAETIKDAHDLVRVIADHKEGAKCLILGTPELKILRTLEQPCHYVIRVISGAPDTDYSGPWSMQVSDLPSVNVGAIMATRSADPSERVQSEVSAEAQERQFEKTIDTLEAALKDVDEVDFSAIGEAGQDDTTTESDLN